MLKSVHAVHVNIPNRFTVTKLYKAVAEESIFGSNSSLFFQ